jgi:lysophospholipase L1-like esterase
VTDFNHYIALGDSMSIDLYPSLDLGHEVNELPVGAASLLHVNHDATWPEMSGKDLSTRCPGIELTNLTSDGATTSLVLNSQLSTVRRIAGNAERTLVTLTIGGNDLLEALADLATIEQAARRTASNVARCLDKLATVLPGASTIVTTVYDPTDGTGNLPGVSELLGELPIEHLYSLNDSIREHAGRERTFLADAQLHFEGHGLTAPEDDRWYWERSPIEPNARGAHELRMLWLETLKAIGD